MAENSHSEKLCMKSLLCPQLYRQLEERWADTSACCPSFDCMLNSLLLAAPTITLRVNTLRCTDTSAALAEAEKCLGLKGRIHPALPDVLLFPRSPSPFRESSELPKESVASGVRAFPLAAEEAAGVAGGAAFPEVKGAPFRRLPMVVVGPQCGQAVLRGAHVFAPGVLAAERGIREGASVGVWALPRPFKAANTPAQHGHRASAADFSSPPSRGDSSLQTPLLRGAYLDGDSRKAVERLGGLCGLGRLVQSLKDVFLNGKGVAIHMEGANDLSCLPPSLVAQQLPSAVVSHVLSPRAGDTVLDMCAAPGHKASHLAALMGNEGLLVAVERSRRRVEQMRALLAKLGASAVECVQGDSAKSKWRCSLGPASALAGKFDRVLADVPCTGLGLRPRIVFDDVNVQSVAAAAEYQREFLSRGCEMLKTGGVLVYSTCSISWEENEGNVQWALKNLPLELKPAEPLCNRQQRPGVRTPRDACKIQRFCPGLFQLDAFGLGNGRGNRGGFVERLLLRDASELRVRRADSHHGKKDVEAREQHPEETEVGGWPICVIRYMDTAAYTTVTARKPMFRVLPGEEIFAGEFIEESIVA
ncbi:hypothetical protein Efla_006865 [Eimeria flavescens]